MGRLQFCRLMFDAYSISTLGSHLGTTNKKIRKEYIRKKFWKFPHTPAHKSTSVHTHTLPETHTPAHTSTHLQKPAQTRADPCTPAHLHLPSRMPAHTRTYQCTPAHTHAYSHTPHIYTLDLKNQIKLHVNRPKTKKTRRRRSTD